MPAKTLSKAAAKNAVSLRAAGFPKSTPQPENTFGYQLRSCAGGAAFLPALDRGQEAIDRAHRSNAQCADVCKKLRSPDGFCRGVSFHLNKKLPGKCCMTGNNVYPRDKLNHFKFLGIGHQFLVQVVGRRGEKMTQRFL
jgi:hypothetical protein